MMQPSRCLPLALSASALLVLSACASSPQVPVQAALDRLNQTDPSVKAQLYQGQAERNAAQDEALSMLQSGPLQQEQAVAMALLNSPRFQALLAQNAQRLAQAAQAGRISNPVFTFERLRLLDELELGRLLTFGLSELLTLPLRQDLAAKQVEVAQLQFNATVLNHMRQVRLAWVRAVAAQQQLSYARQVRDSAQVSADLAKRMQLAGNFNLLERARQHAFYADATTRMAQAELDLNQRRQTLVRLLGLDAEQAKALVLPDRLPDLPAEAPLPAPFSVDWLNPRLDVQITRAQLDRALRAAGLGKLGSLVDIDLGVRRDTVYEKDANEVNNKRGFELEIKIPVFDSGNLRRQALNASVLEALNLHEQALRGAASHLQQSATDLLGRYAIAKHFRDEVVPLRKTISDQNLLRYNAMLIGVFELLADARDQVSVVQSALTAQEQYWTAQADWQVAQLGITDELMPAQPHGVSPAAAMPASPHPAAQAAGPGGH